MFQAAAWLISQFYNLTSDYAAAIALVAVVIMMLIFPLTLKSTKSMLEMQRVQPEMKRLQNQYRNDRQKLNEEMMKLYQEHKVNPLASCLPMLAQMPIFLIMFRVLHGLSNKATVNGVEVIQPDYISKTSKLYENLNGAKEMLSLGIDLSLTPVKAIQDNPGTGVIYALLVVALMGLYFVQQRMIASRTVSPGMSATQAKIMQYLPVAFGIFQFFFPVGLVVYYISQTLVRIAQQQYITRRFYRGEHSLGQQAQAASGKARELAKDEGATGGFFGQMKHDLAKAKEQPKNVTPGKGSQSGPTVSKRVTPPKGGGTPAKGKPTPPNRPKPSGQSRHPKSPRG